MRPIIIIGAGMAGYTAARELRKLDKAVPLTIISVIPQVPATGAYGVTWAVPFIWMTIWGIITIRWCKSEMVRERLNWEAEDGVVVKGGGMQNRSEENSVSAS